MRPPRATLAAGCLALAGCALFEREPIAPREPAVAPDQQYLTHRSPAAGIDVGPGQKTMLETLNEAQEERAALARRIEALEAEKKELLARARAVESERDQERALRVAASAERDDARKQAADRDARLLNLAIQKTQLEQEILVLKIASLEKERAGGMARGDPEAGAEPPARQRPHAGPGVDR